MKKISLLFVSIILIFSFCNTTEDNDDFLGGTLGMRGEVRKIGGEKGERGERRKGKKRERKKENLLICFDPRKKH